MAGDGLFLQAGFVFDGGEQVVLGGEGEGLFGETEGEGGTLGEVLSPGEGFFKQVVGGHDFVGESPVETLFGGDGLAFDCHLVGAAVADLAHEEPGGARIWHEGDVAEGHHEAGVVAHHLQVAGQGEGHACASGYPVNGSDDGLFERGDESHEGLVGVDDAVVEVIGSGDGGNGR